MTQSTTKRFPTLIAILLFPTLAFGAQLDSPTLFSDVQGHAKIVTLVVDGPSGAPAGFTVQWMRFSDFLAHDGSFYDSPSALMGEARFWGTPTVNTWDGTLTSFVLGPSGVAAVEIGDLYDETGVTKSAAADLELERNTPYIFRARADADGVSEASVWSNNFTIASRLNVNCTYTQGYWRTHGPAACVTGNNQNQWPVDNLMLGSVIYSDTDLCSILQTPAAGNGLLILAHQLITTLLNIARGADDTDVAAAVASAQTLIDGLVIPPVGGGYLDPAVASPVAQIFDDYNNGVIGPGHCGPTALDAVSWSKVKSKYR
jgi:hypothetical protein